MSRTLNISISPKVVEQEISLGRGLIYTAIKCNIILILTIASSSSCSSSSSISSSSSSSSIHKVTIFKIHLLNFKEDQPIEYKFQIQCTEINKSQKKISDTDCTIMYFPIRMTTMTMKIPITMMNKTLFHIVDRAKEWEVYLT